MSSRLARLAAAIIRWHRADFVADYGDDMLETFRTRAARARTRGRTAAAWFTARELAGLAWGVVTERARLARLAAGQQIEEIRLATRRLAGAPAFTAASLLTLGVAIGANTAVITLVHRIAVAPLPYPHADRLIALDHAAPGLGLTDGIGMSIGTYREYAKLRSIEAIALYTVQEGTLSDSGDATRADFLQATPSLGGLVGLAPSLGRWFTEADGIAGAPAVAVLGDALWRARFGASVDALGKTLVVDGNPHEVVGVLPPGGAYPDPRVQFVVPLPLPRVWTRAAGFNYAGVARLAPGADLAQARREQDAVIAGLPGQYPLDPEATAAALGTARLASRPRPLKDAVVGETTTTLWVLLAAAAVVLLIACANLANLVLVRTDGRQREVMIRRALGASRAALARNLLTETVLLGLVGGAGLGLMIAHGAIAVLVQGAPLDLPRLHEVRVGGVAIISTIVISLLSGLLLGLVPWLRHAGRPVLGLAGSGRAATAGAASMRTRHILMAVQVSLAVVLLSAAGLMVRSFANLLRVDPGFQSASRLVFRVSLPRTEYRTRPEAAAFHAAMLDRLRALPGVASAGVTSTLPLDGPGLGDPLAVRGRPVDANNAAPIARSRRVSNGYFAAMGIPLRAGRGFDAADEAGSTSSVIINEALARLYFGDRDPAGQQIRPVEGDPLDRWLTIVGVVGNTATESLHEASAVPTMYVPLQGAMWADVPSPHTVSYVVHTAGSVTAQVPAIRAMLQGMNPRVALHRPERLEEVIVRARAARSFAMVLLVVAAVVALVVGVVGVYAVIAYGVSQRRVEIGLRLAIGATPSAVTLMVMRQSGRVIVIGVVLGMAGALATSRLVRALLFGVEPGDLATHLGVGGALYIVAMAACWWPARLAARLNPIDSLRRG